MSVGWLEADWPAPRGVRVVSTRRQGGVSSGCYASLNLGTHVGDDPLAVAENRRRLTAAAALPGEPRWLAQVHGVQVCNLDQPTVGDFDASYTCRRGTVCAILTADCLPVMFASADGDAVGAAHAGWRGLAGGVLEAAVGAMGIRPERLIAWLGPAIGPAHFEVGPEVRDAFISNNPEAVQAFALNSRGRYMADLPALARQRLNGLGVEQIYGGGACTFDDPERYFSHRRDGTTGRQASFIWLETLELTGFGPHLNVNPTDFARC